MSKSRTSGRSPFGRRADRTGSVEVFIRPERSVLVRLAAVLWQLRTELTALVVGVWGWLWLTARLPVWAALAVVFVTAGAVMAWRPSCRFVVGHVWCTVTRHRLRSCLVQSRVMNYRGYVPWCLWVRPTKVGERVWLLMRPGICVEDLEAKTPQIAAACWARDARVRAMRRLVAVVAVDVIRRDPLTTGRLIGSPLPAMTDSAPRSGLAGLPVDFGGDHAVPRLRDDAEEWEFGPDASSAVLREAVRRRHLRAVHETETPRPAAKTSVTPAEAAKPAQSVRPARPVARPSGPGAVSSSGEDVSDYV